jgi:hypothetical protein
MTRHLSTVLALAIPVSRHQRFDRVGRDFRYWQILLQKSFSGEDRKF